MLVKGIKKGNIIELLEQVEIPDNQEILIDIKETGDFWSSYQNFRAKIEAEDIIFSEDDFTDLRDKSIGREINL